MRLTPRVPLRTIVLLVALVLLAALVVASGWFYVNGVAASPGLQNTGGVTVGATASSDNFTVYAATPETARKTTALAEKAWETLAPRFPAVPEEPVVIVVAEDPAEYERIQPAPMTRGFATFGGNRIYLRGPDLDQEVVTHELAHIMLGKNVRPGLEIPDWFNEGFAQYVSNSAGHPLEIFYSRASGRLLSMQELDRVDALAGPDRELATIEGLAIVEFLVHEYGDEALWDLVSHFSHSRSFGQALLDTYGRSDLELNDEWLAYADTKYGIISVVGLETVATTAFGMLALIALGVWATTKIRLRKNPRSPLDLSEWEVFEAERAAAALDMFGDPGSDPDAIEGDPSGSDR